MEMTFVSNIFQEFSLFRCLDLNLRTQTYDWGRKMVNRTRGQYTRNIVLRRSRVTTVAVEKQ
jgi:hypothetical protein